MFACSLQERVPFTENRISTAQNSTESAVGMLFPMFASSQFVEEQRR